MVGVVVTTASVLLGGCYYMDGSNKAEQVQN